MEYFIPYVIAICPIKPDFHLINLTIDCFDNLMQ